MMKQILVVDDEECIRFTFSNFLTGRGYQVSVAASFEEAIYFIRRKRFDLVIADVILPGKSGLELLKVVRRANPSTPVVIITGGQNKEILTEVQRLGATGYMLKPVRQDALLRAARMALQQ